VREPGTTPFGRPPLATLALLAGALLAGAPAGAAPPFDLADQARVAAGRERFESTCTGYCHGRGGLPARGPRLFDRPELDPDRIFATITGGRKRAGKVMPAFKGQLPDEEIWQLTAYVAWLAGQKEAPR
jgi:mono/diheme cytochrome c family protein